MADPRPVGVFDSGIGGLPIAKKIRELLPAENIIYVADSYHAPYGEKSEDFILQRSFCVTEFLLKHDVKAMVVACNTATMVSIKTLRQTYSLPFIGVEPGIKPAALSSRTGVIGVLATAKTLVSQSFTELAARVAGNVTVQIQPCPDLVTLVEALKLDYAQTASVVESYLQPLLAKGADTIILGCTHFTHLKPVIEQVAGPDIVIISTESAVAKETQRRLKLANLMMDSVLTGDQQFFSNGDADLFYQQIERLWGKTAQVDSFDLC